MRVFIVSFRVPGDIFCKSLYLQELCSPQEGLKVTLGDVDLPHVDELEDGVEVDEWNISQDKHRVLPMTDAWKMVQCKQA